MWQKLFGTAAPPPDPELTEVNPLDQGPWSTGDIQQFIAGHVTPENFFKRLNNVWMNRLLDPADTLPSHCCDGGTLDALSGGWVDTLSTLMCLCARRDARSALALLRVVAALSTRDSAVLQRISVVAAASCLQAAQSLWINYAALPANEDAKAELMKRAVSKSSTSGLTALSTVSSQSWSILTKDEAVELLLYASWLLVSVAPEHVSSAVPQGANTTVHDEDASATTRHPWEPSVRLVAEAATVFVDPSSPAAPLSTSSAARFGDLVRAHALRAVQLVSQSDRPWCWKRSGTVLHKTLRRSIVALAWCCLTVAGPYLSPVDLAHLTGAALSLWNPSDGADTLWEQRRDAEHVDAVIRRAATSRLVSIVHRSHLQGGIIEHVSALAQDVALPSPLLVQAPLRLALTFLRTCFHRRWLVGSDAVWRRLVDGLVQRTSIVHGGLAASGVPLSHLVDGIRVLQTLWSWRADQGLRGASSFTSAADDDDLCQVGAALATHLGTTLYQRALSLGKDKDDVCFAFCWQCRELLLAVVSFARATVALGPERPRAFSDVTWHCCRLWHAVSSTLLERFIDRSIAVVPQSAAAQEGSDSSPLELQEALGILWLIMRDGEGTQIVRQAVESNGERCLATHRMGSTPSQVEDWALFLFVALQELSEAMRCGDSVADPALLRTILSWALWWVHGVQPLQRLLTNRFVESVVASGPENARNTSGQRVVSWLSGASAKVAERDDVWIQVRQAALLGVVEQTTILLSAAVRAVWASTPNNRDDDTHRLVITRCLQVQLHCTLQSVVSISAAVVQVGGGVAARTQHAADTVLSQLFLSLQTLYESCTSSSDVGTLSRGESIGDGGQRNCTVTNMMDFTAMDLSEVQALGRCESLGRGWITDASYVNVLGGLVELLWGQPQTRKALLARVDLCVAATFDRAQRRVLSAVLRIFVRRKRNASGRIALSIASYLFRHAVPLARGDTSVVDVAAMEERMTSGVAWLRMIGERQ